MNPPIEMAEPRITLDELPRDTFKMIELLDLAYPEAELHRLCYQAQFHGDPPRLAEKYAGMRELIDHLVALRNDELDRIRAEDEADHDEEGVPRVLQPR